MVGRLRILAGPNGSGKTSVFGELRENFHWGVFVNADEIERRLKEEGCLDCREYAVAEVDEEKFRGAYSDYFCTFSTRSAADNIFVDNACIGVYDTALVDSYFAAFLAAYIREQLLETGISFSVETVMSHPSKVDFMARAHRSGYRVYLYYVSTQSPEINIGRVHTRVQEGGHNVPESKVRERYTRSLRNLYAAVKQSDRAYLFDNSGKHFELLAEYDATDKSVQLYSETEWLRTYLLNMAETTRK